MTVSISEMCCHDLLNIILDFTKSGKQPSLKDFQSIMGHINWSLVVFPLLKPALSTI
jgi:hypothetical protein